MQSISRQYAPHSTLLVGGDPRPGADHCPLERLAELAGQRYLEVVVQLSLELIDDAWSSLRELWDVVDHEGVLTVFYGGSEAPAFRDVDVFSLLRLTSFHFIEEKRVAGRHRIRARPGGRAAQLLSATVVVPCRNEVGNVSALVARLPVIGSATELLFVDGASTDGTPDRIRRLIEEHRDRDIKLLEQNGAGGKAAAVFQGFASATGDVVMILDADMTVAPEDLPRFFLAVAEDVADFANGSRFAYPMQAGAMPALNGLGNRAFGSFLSWLLDTRITDSLCGTKCFRRSDWRRIEVSRPLFGGHDPWGDFDLLLGAAHAGMRIVDVPIRYYARVAGESKMRPFLHGVALTRTCVAGVQRLKFSPDRRAGA